MKLALKADEIISVKGKNVTRLALNDDPGDQAILAAMLGPSGNLRAPAAMSGKKLLVGFDAGIYAEHLR